MQAGPEVRDRLKERKIAPLESTRRVWTGEVSHISYYAALFSGIRVRRVSEAFQQKLLRACQNPLPNISVGEHTGYFDGSDHRGEDRKERAFFVHGSPAWHEANQVRLVFHHRGAESLLQIAVCSREFGTKCR